MELPALITSDLHFTANPRDEYRWGLFRFLADQCRAEQVKSLLILGDLTDAKDYHPASLVNRIMDELRGLPPVQIYILQGNHDYLQRGRAFFSFLNHFPTIRFITQPTDTVDEDGVNALFLPHTRTPAADWEGMRFDDFAYVFMHQTVNGAVASNGQRMDGEHVPKIRGPKVYSGDIHVPQVISGVEYVGSPYHVHFGDNFKPRCVLIDRWNKPHDLHFKTVRRVSITVSSLKELARQELSKGDHVKVRIRLAQADKHAWHRIKRDAVALLKEAEVEMFGVDLALEAANATQADLRHDSPRIKLSDAEVVQRFVQAEELGGDALDTALEIVP